MSGVCRQPRTARGFVDQVQFHATTDRFTSANPLQEVQVSLTLALKDAPAVSIGALLDSGANICLAGPKQRTQLGLQPHQLRPCTK